MEYKTFTGAQKEVVLFVADKVSGQEKSQESEIKTIEWMNFEDALKTITHDNAKDLFRKVLIDEEKI